MNEKDRNIARHRILKCLYDRFNFDTDNKGIVSEKSKVEIKYLLDTLKIDRNEFFQIITILNQNKEVIIKTNSNKVVNGNSLIKQKDTAFITTKGAVSYQNETYKKANKIKNKKILLEWVQIIIPIIAVGISLSAVMLRNKPLQQRVNQIQRELDMLKTNQNQLEYNPTEISLRADTCENQKDSVRF